MRRFHPIQFTTEMMRANMFGIKSETRRTNRLNEINAEGIYVEARETFFSAWLFQSFGDTIRTVNCPYGYVGDILWFREAFHQSFTPALEGKFFYKALLEGQGWDFKWKPAIHMPAKACRMWGIIKRVRVERLYDIDHISAMREGVVERDGKYPVQVYNELFRSIYGDELANKNPWLWVISYDVTTEAPEGWSEYLEELEAKRK